MSPSLLSARPRLDPVHVNADFFDQASDHDPLIVRFALGGDDDDDEREDDDDEGEDEDGDRGDDRRDRTDD